MLPQPPCPVPQPPPPPPLRQARCCTQGQQLVCSGFGYGNILASVNDGCIDPMSFQPNAQDRPANVWLLPVAVGRWPFLFMVASQDIELGTHMACMPQQQENKTEYMILLGRSVYRSLEDFSSLPVIFLNRIVSPLVCLNTELCNDGHFAMDEPTTNTMATDLASLAPCVRFIARRAILGLWQELLGDSERPWDGDQGMAERA